ncbi:MAG: hypothetical protein M3R36_11905 [Bacteroidota bacterium]|nr:hypothetical protein [Bacteroidota bacterium]
MIDSISEEYLSDFTYSKKSHFNFFKDKGYDIELYETNLNLNEDVDLITYQNLMTYSFLKNKKNLKILQIGEKSLLSFEKLQSKHEFWKINIEDLSKSPDEFRFFPINENKQIAISNSKSYFDFIFLSSAPVTLPKENNIFDSIFLNIKYLLKAKGILLCSYINVISRGQVWFDKMFGFLSKEKTVMNKAISYSKIYDNPDLLVLSEVFYNKNWKQYTNKTYKDFGKAFIYNLFIENKEKISPENFSNFTYLMKSHKDFYISNGYAEELFNKNGKSEYELEDYKSLLIYTFIKSNFKKGDKILQIGNAPGYLEKSISKDYDFFKLEDLNLLTDNLNFDEKISNGIKNGKSKKNDYKNIFNFSYSVNAFENDDYNPFKYRNIINNINRVMLAGGLTIFSFSLKISNDKIRNSTFLPFIFHNVFNLNEFVHVHSEEDRTPGENTSFKIFTINNNTKLNTKESIYNVLWKKICFLPASCKTAYHNRLKDYPVYLFHHLIKCGGTSLFVVLEKWFKTIDDNILLEDLNPYILKKYNTNIFHNDICLRAHFQRDGIYVHQRYPELLNNKDECRTFTFIRNPLSIKVSKYYFLKSIKAIREDVRLTDSLMLESNFIASLFPCDETNYKQIIDKYFFVGIVERLQESFDLFADLIGKKEEKIPLLNTSEKDSQMNELTPEFLKKFKNHNVLDYKIYDYCLEKFNKLSDSNLNGRAYEYMNNLRKKK